MCCGAAWLWLGCTQIETLTLGKFGVYIMGQIGIWQIVIIAVVVVLLFGRGKISDLMGDVAKGINSFKKA